ncbi:MAG: SdpI family protein [Acutalibacteraceae bacterium]
MAPVKERNKTKGYRTNLSLKTEETWNYAQRIFAVIWMIFGVCLAGLIVLCNFIIPISHEVRSVIFVVASISVMMCCTPITEGMIKRKFRGQLNGL